MKQKDNGIWAYWTAGLKGTFSYPPPICVKETHLGAVGMAQSVQYLPLYKLEDQDQQPSHRRWAW